MAANWNHFYQKSAEQRLALVAQWAHLTPSQLNDLQQTNAPIFDHLIENYLADYALPEGVVTHLTVNGTAYLVPMVIEEPSVIAAASNGSKLLSAGQGISATIKERLLGGEVVMKNASNAALSALVARQQVTLIQLANASHPSILRHGGGAKRLTVRKLDDQFTAVDLLVDPGEAMGANLINTMLEAVAGWFRDRQYDVIMAILTNNADHSLVRVQGTISFDRLGATLEAGRNVADRIADASTVAEIDPHRAVTNNKGIMNGVDAVVLAMGNDWRAVESAVHAFAASTGQYRGLSHWRVTQTGLTGDMTIPLPVGYVGGAAGVFQMVAVNHAIAHVTDVSELMKVIAAVGLAQNLAALKALVTDGIQKGHMSLQLKSLAMANGTKPAELGFIVGELRKLAQPDAEDVKQLLVQLRKQDFHE